MSTETHPEAAGLAEQLREVIDANAGWSVDALTSQVDAVLDVFRDHLTARLTDDDVVEAAAEAMADRNGWDSVTAVYYDDIRAALRAAAAVIGASNE